MADVKKVPNPDEERHVKAAELARRKFKKKHGWAEVRDGYSDSLWVYPFCPLCGCHLRTRHVESFWDQSNRTALPPTPFVHHNYNADPILQVIFHCVRRSCGGSISIIVCEDGFANFVGRSG
jgi:hypothetical protein